MSKVDAMQAIREARYAARTTAGPVAPATRAAVGPPGVRPVAAATTAATTAATAPPEAAVAEEPEAATEAAIEALCGHRSMNNRNCRRPAGHAEKNHRYQ